MNKLIIFFISVVLISCNKASVNKSDEIVSHQKLMDQLNSGDNNKIQSEININSTSEEKIILASSLSSSAGIDIYTLLPLIKDKYLTKPLINNTSNETISQLTKRITKNLELTINLDLGPKDIENFLFSLDEIISQTDKGTNEEVSPEAARVKAALTIIEPKLAKVLQLKRTELLDFLYHLKDDIIQKTRNNQADDGHIKISLNIGKVNKSAFNLFASTLELISISNNVPEISEEGYHKIDEAINVLDSIGIKDFKNYIKAQKQIAVLSSIIIINNAKKIFAIHGDHTTLICENSEHNISNFINGTSVYFNRLHTASQKITEINGSSFFVQLAKNVQQFTSQGEVAQKNAISSVNNFLTEEKRKICE